MTSSTISIMTERECQHGEADRLSCRKCKRADYMRAWYRREGNAEKAIKLTTAYRQSQKQAALDHYGSQCECCGETYPAFLSVDHVAGDGKMHRSSMPATDGKNMWRWLVRNNFPPGFRILCLNCNIGAYRNGNICPHEQMKADFDREEA